MERRILFILFLLFSFCLGCISEGSKVSSGDAVSACVLECQNLKSTANYSNGPCLSNEIMPDWVCDVAHNPRQGVDNQPENQCSSFREGKAHHFVEVDENCLLIRSIEDE